MQSCELHCLKCGVVDSNQQKALLHRWDKKLIMYCSVHEDDKQGKMNNDFNDIWN